MFIAQTDEFNSLLGAVQNYLDTQIALCSTPVVNHGPVTKSLLRKLSDELDGAVTSLVLEESKITQGGYAIESCSPKWLSVSELYYFACQANFIWSMKEFEDLISMVQSSSAGNIKILPK